MIEVMNIYVLNFDIKIAKLNTSKVLRLIQLKLTFAFMYLVFWYIFPAEQINHQLSVNFVLIQLPCSKFDLSNVFLQISGGNCKYL